jgi:hypothetical protein
MLASHSEGKIYHRLYSVFSAVRVNRNSANFLHFNKKENGLTKASMEEYIDYKNAGVVINSNPMLWLSCQSGFRVSSLQVSPITTDIPDDARIF